MLTEVHGIKRLSQHTGTVFRFLISTRNRTRNFRLEYETAAMTIFANPPRCAAPVASTSFGDQNTTHLMSFSLRDTQPFFKIWEPL